MHSQTFTLQVENIPIVGQLYLPGTVQTLRFPAVIICHGIPAQSQTPEESGYPLLAQRVCQAGFATVFFNFRGAGLSGGNFDLPGWTRDLRAVIAHVYSLPEVDTAHIGLFGFSGGAAVSVCVAAADPRVALVAACACPAEFPGFSEHKQARAAVAYFRKVGIIRDKDFPADADEWYRSFSSVRPIDCVEKIAPRKLLVAHGGQDDTVPVEHARRLYEKAGEPKQLLILEGAGHRLRQVDAAMDAVIDWLIHNAR